jgi:hypothetical protein
MPEPDGLVAVFLTVGVRTSAGPGPGVVRVPAGEAAALVARKHGVYGEVPPAGFSGGDGRAASN